MNPSSIEGSFRDPSGFVIFEDGQYKRIVTHIGKVDYQAFMQSGLFEQFTHREQLIFHLEESIPDEKGFKKLKPEQIPFISYPYEWSFSQLKDAALLTLDIQIESLKKGFSLKDASPFNIQFKGCHPVLIDTLSFELNQHQPWVAYKQFCEAFLAPLALMAYRDSNFNRYLQVDFNGIELGHCSLLLPKKTFLNVGILTHIHLHAKSQIKFQKKNLNHQNPGYLQYPLHKKIALTEHLKNTVMALEAFQADSFWTHYYQSEQNNYSDEDRDLKLKFVRGCLEETSPDIVLDLGCNTGQFSQLALDKNLFTLSVDLDANCVDNLYQRGKSRNERNNLPLVLNLANPTPSLGWLSKERPSFFSRLSSKGRVFGFALALIHHLRISCHISIRNQAKFLSNSCSWLVIEFIPKIDSMVQTMLLNREDIFDDLEMDQFEKIFGEFFYLEKKEKIKSHDRVLYFMKRK